MNEQKKQGELKRTIGLPLLVGFGLAYLAPTVVFNYYGLWTAESGTGGHYPLALIITTILMVFTGLSYTYMVKEFPVAGSAYIYVNRSINPHIGFIAGWIMLLDYLLLPMAGFLLLGIYGHEYFPQIPAVVIVIAVAAICAILNIIGARVASMIDTIIIAAQLIFTAATIIVCIVYVCGGGGTGTLFSSTAIYNPETFGFSKVMHAAAILCLSFVGFDAVTTMVEEVKNPDKVMGKAIMLIVAGAGILFFITAYVMNLAWPEGIYQIEDPDTGIFEFYPAIGYGWMTDVFFVVDNCASFICSLAAVGAGSRILYGMGRDNIIPKQFFASISPKFNTPVKNILLTTILPMIIGMACVNNLGAALDLVSFGVIIGFILVNVSVFSLFWVKRKERGGAAVIKYVILPLISVAFLVFAFIFTGAGAKIIGAVWTVLGIIYLGIKTKGFKELPPEMEFDE